MVTEGHAKLARLERQAANNKHNLPSKLVNPVLALDDHTVCLADINANLKANLVYSLEEEQNARNLERIKKESRLGNDLEKNNLSTGNQEVVGSVRLEKLKLASELLKLGPTPPRPPRCLLEPQLCQNHQHINNSNNNHNNQLQNFNKGKQLHNLLAHSESGCEEGMWSWRRRRWFALVLLATVLFVTATCLPFLVDRLRNKSKPSFSQPSLSPHLPRLPTLWAQQSFPRHTPQRQNLGAKINGSPLLQELFLSVKTTERFHYPRLVIILETWGSLAKEQTWYFTDTSNSSTDGELERRSGGHLVRTSCPASHHRLSLCCKMEQEFEHFLRSHKQWWCHFDDDNYVNIAALLDTLEQYEASKPWYLGKTSTASPLKIVHPQGNSNSSFWFATGGAGFCVSRTLALRMAPLAVDGGFVQAGNQFWFPDDVTMGFLVEHELGVPLTVLSEFHSHLEPMAAIRQEELPTQVSFSYLLEGKSPNVVEIEGPFPPSIDPTRFYSLHCLLYGAAFCPSNS